ncbi:MAG: lysoplasmalogenase family protein [Mycobacteriales bacterium]|nr:lysoplasmalogenase family protein [Mycobacteriales bacterium]
MLKKTYAALAVTDALLAATGRAGPRRVTKPLLMPVLAASSDRPSQRALALGWGGDVALLGSSPAAFTTGLASFLVGHAAWIAAVRGRGGGGLLRRRPAAAAPYALAWAGLNAYLWSRTGRDRLPVLAYSGALAAMALTALDSGDARTATGGALFMASDSLLALEKFGGVHLPLHEGLVMASYTAAQALLASDAD